MITLQKVQYLENSLPSGTHVQNLCSFQYTYKVYYRQTSLLNASQVQIHVFVGACEGN